MGRRKGSGEGSIFKQGKKWRGQITINGERKSVSGDTKKEVADKLAEIRYKASHGEYAKRSDLTVYEWVNIWLNDYASKTLSEESLKHIRLMFDRYITEQLGAMKLQDITPAILNSFYQDRFSMYSVNTVRGFSTQFKRCFQTAVELELLVKNPHVIQYAKYKPPKKVSSYTNADQQKIIEYCKKNKKTCGIYYFLISTGMRFGEAAALTWTDVDLNSGEVRINKTTTMGIGGTIIKDSTKTPSGIRTIFIGPNIIDWLTSYKESYKTSEFVFPSRSGGVLSQSTAIRRWNQVLNDLNIPHRGIHSLRHTWGTRALEAGIDIKTVSAMLGHKNIITTMNVYQDVLDSQKKKAACTLDALY